MSSRDNNGHSALLVGTAGWSNGLLARRAHNLPLRSSSWGIEVGGSSEESCPSTDGPSARVFTMLGTVKSVCIKR